MKKKSQSTGYIYPAREYPRCPLDHKQMFWFNIPGEDNFKIFNHRYGWRCACGYTEYWEKCK
jgi:hypothetical protein